MSSMGVPGDGLDRAPNGNQQRMVKGRYEQLVLASKANLADKGLMAARKFSWLMDGMIQDFEESLASAFAAFSPENQGPMITIHALPLDILQRIVAGADDPNCMLVCQLFYLLALRCRDSIKEDVVTERHILSESLRCFRVDCRADTSVLERAVMVLERYGSVDTVELFGRPAIGIVPSMQKLRSLSLRIKGIDVASLCEALPKAKGLEELKLQYVNERGTELIRALSECRSLQSLVLIETNFTNWTRVFGLSVRCLHIAHEVAPENVACEFVQANNALEYIALEWREPVMNEGLLQTLNSAVNVKTLSVTLRNFSERVPDFLDHLRCASTLRELRMHDLPRVPARAPLGLLERLVFCDYERPRRRYSILQSLSKLRSLTVATRTGGCFAMLTCLTGLRDLSIIADNVDEDVEHLSTAAVEQVKRMVPQLTTLHLSAALFAPSDVEQICAVAGRHPCTVTDDFVDGLAYELVPGEYLWL